MHEGVSEATKGASSAWSSTWYVEQGLISFSCSLWMRSAIFADDGLVGMDVLLAQRLHQLLLLLAAKDAGVVATAVHLPSRSGKAQLVSCSECGSILPPATLQCASVDAVGCSD